jgi:hypothetical protein
MVVGYQTRSQNKTNFSQARANITRITLTLKQFLYPVWQFLSRILMNRYNNREGENFFASGLCSHTAIAL